MSGWGKFGVVLYCSTTLAATVAVGFALFIGAAPSNINLFDKNRDVRNWLFIAAAASLVYITLSAFTMFCVLVSKSTKKPNSKGVNTDSITDNLQQKSKAADVGNPLLQPCNTIITLPVKSAINSQQPTNRESISPKNIKKVDYINEEVDVSCSSTDCFRSNYFNSKPSSQLHLNQETNNLTKMDERADNGSEMIDERREQRCLPMYVPQHIYLSMWPDTR